MRRFPAALSLFLSVLAPAKGADAHNGPPFPLLMEQRVGPYVASVWTDPDIGIATFIVVLESPEGKRVDLAPATVRVGVRPRSGRRPEVVTVADPKRARHGFRHVAKVSFDQRELWIVRLEIEGAAGGGTLIADVLATPEGPPGFWALSLYLLPFLAVGFLWFRAARIRRRDARATPPATA